MPTLAVFRLAFGLLLVLAAGRATPGRAQDRAAAGRYAVHFGRIAPEDAAATTAAPAPPRLARTTPPDLGDTRDFNVRFFLNQGWRALNFTLAALGDGFYLWVATNELGRTVGDADVATLADALAVRTPAGSINPAAGILANNHSVYGALPDVDGDAVLDVLWYDVRDDFPAEPPLAGYVALDDLDLAAPPTRGNRADVIYLDTDPLLVGAAFGPARVQEVAAGLHQVLIQFTYDRDDTPFVQAGLFEGAKVLNGYPGTPPLYLGFPDEHNLPLLSWTGSAADPERAGLFTVYLTEQLGVAAAGLLTREPADGLAGYEAVLAALGAARTLPELVFDFHTANLVNDAALEARFGYAAAVRQDVATTPTRRFDASLSGETPPETVVLTAGGVHYVQWENVDNLRVSLAVLDPARQDRVQARLLLRALDGTRTLQDVTPGPTPTRLAGPWEAVTLLVTDAVPEAADGGTPVAVAATWDGTAVPVLNVAYDDGQAASQGPNFLRLNAGARQATRFVVPAGTQLRRVSIAPFFLNQFIDPATALPFGSPGDPRDVTLEVYEDDGTGQPGALRFARTLTDPRPFDYVTTFSLDLLDLDLTDHPELTALPDTVYVALTNAGEDDNVLLLGLSTYTAENVSFLREEDGTDWLRLWDLATGVGPLTERVVPIRAQFGLAAGPTARRPEAALPEAVALLSNYPNPFHPRTTIRYQLPAAVQVRLAVYDVLGRLVAVLAEGVQPAGWHEVPVDATGWAGGVYYYTLTAAEQRRTRAMLLVK